jgi:hypothetical protein
VSGAEILTDATVITTDEIVFVTMIACGVYTVDKFNNGAW